MSDTSNNLSPALEALTRLGWAIKMFSIGHDTTPGSLPAITYVSDGTIIIHANGRELLKIADIDHSSAFSQNLLSVMEMACTLDNLSKGEVLRRQR